MTILTGCPSLVVFTDHFSDPGRAIDLVCLCVCLWTVTFELNDPSCWFILPPSWSSPRRSQANVQDNRTKHVAKVVAWINDAFWISPIDAIIGTSHFCLITVFYRVSVFAFCMFIFTALRCYISLFVNPVVYFFVTARHNKRIDIRAWVNAGNCVASL